MSVEGLSYRRHADARRHFAVVVEVDPEVVGVGVEIERTRKRSARAKIGGKNAIGDAEALGFSPDCGSASSDVVDAEDKVEGATRDVGAVEVDYPTLEGNFVVNAGGGKYRGASQSK